MRAVWVLLLLAGCVRDDLVTCANGLACPADLVCDEPHDRCVSQSQLDVCSGALEGADCASDVVTGACLDGVCLERGCGNGYVEMGEVCDDGNRISGDGCRYDCGSTEGCGNGQVDPGEVCDDGNLISHDRCDSKCQPELVAFETGGIAHEIAEYVAAWDPVRERLVVVDQTTTWELDGSSWRVVATSGPGLPEATYYDVGRGQVVSVFAAPGGKRVLSAWNGETWTEFAEIILPGAVLVATYDPSRMAAVFVCQLSTTLSVWAVPATGGAVQVATQSSATSIDPGSSAAYDAATGSVIVRLAGAATLRRLNGSSFPSFAAPFDVSDNATLATVDGAPVLAGNGHLYRLAGAVWEDVATLANQPDFLRRLWGNSVMTVRLSDGPEVLDRGPSAWLRSEIPPMAFTATSVTAAGAGRGFVIAAAAAAFGDSTVGLYRLGGGGTHTLVAAGTPPKVRPRALFARSPADGSLLYGMGDGDAFMWRFDGTTWTRLPETIAPDLSVDGGIAYDPIARGFISADANVLWQFPDGGDQWIRTTEPSPFVGRTVRGDLAWDARENHVDAALGETDLYELTEHVWSAAPLAPDGPFTMVTNDRTGGIDWVPRAVGARYWQHVDGVWRQGAIPPLPLGLVTAAIAPATGDLISVGVLDGGLAYVIKSVRGPTPDEDCDGLASDADGDHLAGCDDPDCYWACTQCPPYSSCE